MNDFLGAEGCGAFHVGRLSSPLQNNLDKAGLGYYVQLWPISEPSQGLHRGNLEVCDGTLVFSTQEQVV